MTRSSIAIFSIIGTLALAPIAFAQDSDAVQPPANSDNLGHVTQGNKTIFFKSAGQQNIDANQLRTWNEFSEGHPKVAKALAYKPSLMKSDAYLAKHPELGAFFQAHPDIQQAMAENPGNFEAIPPRPGE
jgi:hypothetical protein